MAASNNICSSQEEKGQIKQIALSPTHIPTLGFAMTVKIRGSRILLTNNFQPITKAVFVCWKIDPDLYRDKRFAQFL
jgi:hypothetical protein